MDNFKQIYYELEGGLVDTSKLPPIIRFYNDLKSFKQENFSVIPIAILNYDYNKIKESAIEEGLIKIKNGILYDGIKRGSQTPYSSHKVLTFSPMVERVENNTLSFLLSSAFYFTNTIDEIKNILIDFDDGNGFRVIEWEQKITIEYANFTNRKLKLKFITNSNQYTSTALLSTSNSLLNSTPDDPPWLNALPQGWGTPHKWDITASIPFNGLAKGHAYFKYSFDGIFDKPFILVEGIDFGNTHDEYKLGDLGYQGIFEGNDDKYPFLKHYNQLINSLREQGYDLVLLDFTDGADYIQKNSMLLVELIQMVNAYKVGNNPNVISGASMGGQIARYALAYMEKNKINHCTRLYISMDSPHKGASLPYSIQYMVKWLAEEVGMEMAKDNLQNKLNRPAAKQLLTLQPAIGSVGINDFRIPYEVEMADLDYPKLCRNISIANGNRKGIGLDFQPSAPLINYVWIVAGLLENIRIQAFAMPGRTMFMGKIKQGTGHACGDVSGVFGALFISTTYESPTIVYTGQAINYDNAPGGYRNTVEDMVKKMNEKLSAKCAPTIKEDQYEKYHCFIPTISALDINTDDLFYKFELDLAGNNLTPFDAIWAESEINTQHSEATPGPDGNIQFVLQNVFDYENKLKPILNLSSPNNGIFNYGNPKRDYITDVTIDDGGKLYVNGNLPTEYGTGISSTIGGTFILNTYSCGANIQCNNAGQFILGERINSSTINKAIVNLNEGTIFNVAPGGQLIINEQSTLNVKSGASLTLNGYVEIKDGGSILVETGAALIIEGNVVIQNGAKINVEPGAAVWIKSNAVINIAASGIMDIQKFAYSCLQKNITYIFDNGSVFINDAKPWSFAIAGITPVTCADPCNQEPNCTNVDVPQTFDAHLVLSKESDCALKIIADGTASEGDIAHQFSIQEQGSSDITEFPCVPVSAGNTALFRDNYSYIFNPFTTYIIHLRIFNICGVEAEVSQTIHTNDFFETTVEIQFDPTDMQNGLPVQLNAQISPDISGTEWWYIPTGVYLNNPEAVGTQITDITGNPPASSISANVEGFYRLHAIGGCTGTGFEQRLIYISNCPALANAGLDQTICAGACVALQGEELPRGFIENWIRFDVSWKDEHGNEIQNSAEGDNLFQPVVSPTETTKYIMYVNQIDSKGNQDCQSIDYVTVFVNPNCSAPTRLQGGAIDCSQMAYAGEPETVCRFDPTPIQLGTSGYCETAQNRYTYSWTEDIVNQNSLDDPTIPNPIATPFQTTIYTLSVTYTYKANQSCTSTSQVTITVNPDCIYNPGPGDPGGRLCENPSNPEYVLRSSEAWVGSEKFIIGTLTIPSGINLTITNSRVLMGSCAKIKVERGGKVEIKGSEMFSGCSDKTWRRIEVQGNSNKPQNPIDQGTLIVENSTIKDAETAIFAGKTDASGQPQPGYGGAIIEVKDYSILENNQTHVHFTAYDKPNKSIIENSTLGREWESRNGNSDCISSAPDRKGHIIVDDNPGLIIKGNTFKTRENTAIVLKGTSDFQILDNTIEAPLSIKMEETTVGLTASKIEGNNLQGKTNIDIRDANVSKLSVGCNKMTYTEYGIHSINSILKDQGSRVDGAGNSFISLETNPRLNHQLFHNGTSPMMKYFYDPVAPINLVVTNDLKAMPIKAQKDNGCLTSSARLGNAQPITISAPTSNTLHIFPNPIKHTINIHYKHLRSEGMVQVDIRTISGKLTEVLYQNFTDEDQGINIRYDNADLKPGIYVVKISGDDFTEMGKFVVAE